MEGYILHASPEPLVVFDEGDVCLDANPAACALLGAGLADLVGKRLPSLAGEHHGRAPIELAATVPLVSGRRICALRDLTDRKKIEAQLLSADRLVSVGTLAAGVAHEINNPLAYIAIHLELIREEFAAHDFDSLHSLGEAMEKVREMANQAYEGIERVRQIVRDLKTFSRSHEVTRGPVDLQKVLDSSIKLATAEIRHRARLIRNYAAVPEIIANDSRLSQVFVNLIINAAQAIPEGNVERHEIRIITFTGPSNTAVIEVRDTGEGISPEIMKHIFDPFFTTKPVGIGTGLGLAVCHSIVTDLNGEIQVESELSRGTTFRVILPSTAPVTGSGEDAGRWPTLPTLYRPGKCRILVIDDEPALAHSIGRALEREHEVVVASGGRVGLGLFKHAHAVGRPFDLIICDLMMPEMTGMEFYHELLEACPAMKDRVAFVTGGAFTPKAQEFLAVNPNPRLEKPFNLQEIREMVSRMLRPPSGAGGAGASA